MALGDPAFDIFAPPRPAILLWSGLDVSGRRRDDRAVFEATMDAIRGDVAAAGGFAVNDGYVRQQYQRAISQAAAELREAARSGRITWAQAARKASELRNANMELLRGRSSPIGRSLAESMKAEGLSLDLLLSKYAKRRFGQDARFQTLSQAQKNSVYAEVVSAAARSNPKVNAWAVNASKAGRGLILLSLSVSVYVVATSEEPGQAALKEGVTLSVSFLASLGGGAAAGLACGPGAPLCSLVGAFVGGALAAFGVSYFW
jgi:hypothetical protein